MNQFSKLNIFSLADQSFQKDLKSLSLQEIKREFQLLINSLKTDIDLAIKNEDLKLNYTLCTDACELIKSYGVFLRDIYLEKIYASIKFHSELLSKEKFALFQISQITEYHNTRHSFFEALEKTFDQTIVKPSTSIETYKVTNNPIDIYLGHFDQIKEQLNSIKQFELQSNQLSNKIKYVLDSLIKPLEVLKSKLEKFVDLTNEMVMDSSKSLLEVLNTTTKFQQQLKTSFTKQNELNSFVDSLATIDAYPDRDSGMLKLKVIEASSLIRNWIGISAFPTIEMLEKTSTKIISNTSLSLKFYLDSIEAYNEDDISDLKQLKVNLQNELQALIDKIQLKQKEFKNKLTVNSLIYSNNDFTYNLQNTYVNIKDNAGNNFDKIKAYIKNKIEQYNATFWNSYNRNTLNDSIVNYTKHHRKTVENSLYKKLFLNESGLHDQVIVSRPKESGKINDILNNWLLGVGNSILLTGNEYCGKSTLINSINVSNTFDQKIEIRSGVEIIIEGRKFDLSDNIQENLDIVLKNISPIKKYLIVIEDLESRRNKKIDFLQSISSILRSIDNSPANVFFICSCNLKFAGKLKVLLDCENVFTSILDTSDVDFDVFYLTVLRRLEITQASAKSNKEIDKGRIRRIAKRIFNNNDKNLGLSLIAWVNHHELEKEDISRTNESTNFPWIIDARNIQLFDNLLTFGSCTYQELLQNFTDEKKPIIKNLISRYRRLGVIDNNGDQIFINKFLVDTIEKQLSYREDRKQAQYNYQLKTTLPDNTSVINMISKIKKNLLFFPFSSSLSRVSFEKNDTSLDVVINAYEAPSRIIKFINNKTSNFKLEFKQNN